MAKKFFWLKLKDDFFKQREIKKLRKIAGGDTYTIIYLKMQLLSVKNEGKIFYEGTENNLAEQLELEIDEEVENIEITLSYLKNNNLIEITNENEYFLPKACESIGKETDSAERMRRLREKKASQCYELPSQNDSDVTKSDTEKEKEKELNKEKDNSSVGELFKFYDNNIQPLTEYITDKINLFLDDGIDDELMLRYFQIAVERKKCNWAYIQAIAQNNLSDGIKTVSQYEESERQFKEKQIIKINTNKVEQVNNFKQREYEKDEFEQFYSNK